MQLFARPFDLVKSVNMKLDCCPHIARNYVSVLNVMKAASNASRPELSTADKARLESEACVIWLMTLDISGWPSNREHLIPKQSSTDPSQRHCLQRVLARLIR